MTAFIVIRDSWGLAVAGLVVAVGIYLALVTR